MHKMDGLRNVIVSQPVLADNKEIPLSFNMIKTDAVGKVSMNSITNTKNGILEFLGISDKHEDNREDRLLQISCRYGNIYAIRNVLKQYNPDVNRRGLDGYTPLCIALAEKKEDIAKSLLEQPDIDTNIPFQDTCGVRKTPLHFACENGSLSLVDLLISTGSDVNAVDSENATPLYLASFKGFTEVVRLLISKGAKVTVHQTTNKSGTGIKSPLHAAVYTCHPETVEILCKEGAEVNQLNSSGQSPLLLACIIGHIGLIRTLLDYGASPNLTDSLGQTPLLSVLMEKTSQHKVQEGTLKTATPDKCLQDNSNSSIDPLLNLKLIQMLLDAGAYIDAVDDFGYSAFDYCLKYGNVTVLALLVKNGAHARLPQKHETSQWKNDISKMMMLLVHLSLSYKRHVNACVINNSTFSAKNNKQLFSKLHSMASLQEHCRLNIRECLKEDSKLTVLEQIDVLPITETMKRYISLVDLCNIYIKNPS